jgi:hypothetical protein
VTITRIAAPFVVALVACTAPTQFGGAIPIDHEGLAARLRRACELGRATATGAACASGEGTDAEVEGADELEEFDASPDAECEAADAAPTAND